MERVSGSAPLKPTTANQYRWIFILIPAPNAGVTFETTDEEYLKRVKEFVGDDSIPVEIMSVSRWFINETVAEYYSDGNM
jgi:hypothetical protein